MAARQKDYALLLMAPPWKRVTVGRLRAQVAMLTAGRIGLGEFSRWFVVRTHFCQWWASSELKQMIYGVQFALRDCCKARHPRREGGRMENLFQDLAAAVRLPEPAGTNVPAARSPDSR